MIFYLLIRFFSKLQRKRHIGNDIVCVVFLEADNTSFSPACIKSHFLHTFIIIKTSVKRKCSPTRYEVGFLFLTESVSFLDFLMKKECQYPLRIITSKQKYFTLTFDFFLGSITGRIAEPNMDVEEND